MDFSPDIEKFDYSLLESLRQWFRYEFPLHIGQCHIVDIVDIDFNFKSSAGAFYGYQTKAEVIANHIDDFMLFWELGHVYNWVYPYVLKLKSELLPMDKILDHRGRIYCVEDVVSLSRTLRLTQSMNEAISFSGTPTSPFMKGYNPFQGGTNSFVRQCFSYFDDFVIYKSDCTKYDKRACPVSKMYAKLIRYLFIHPDDFKEFDLRISHVYDNMIIMYAISPDGSVFRLETSHPSGCGVTTDDNNIHHAVIIVDMFVSETGLPVTEMRSHFVFHCMSDDNLVVVNRNSPFCDVFCNFSVREKYYKKHGRLLKPEEDKVYAPNTVEGVHWLGCDWVWSRSYGAYVGVYNLPKLVTSAGLQDDLDLVERSMKFASFCLLGVFDDNFWNFMYPIYLQSCARAKIIGKPREYFERLWLGFESADCLLVSRTLTMVERFQFFS